MVGSWVLFSYCGEVRLGYVDYEYGNLYSIHDPIHRCHYTKDKRTVAVAPDILYPEDRDTLIDLALDLKDREWFYSLVGGGDAVVTTHGGE